MSNEIRQIPGTVTELDGSEWVEVQTAAGGAGSSKKVQTAAFAAIGIVRVDHVADYPMAASDLNALHTNIGAADVVTLTMPPALIGQGALFFSEGNYDLVIEPNGTDTISTGGTGKSVTLRSRGLVILDCIANAGQWDITSDGDAFYELEA